MTETIDEQNDTVQIMDSAQITEMNTQIYNEVGVANDEENVHIVDDEEIKTKRTFDDKNSSNINQIICNEKDAELKRKETAYLTLSHLTKHNNASKNATLYFYNFN